MIFGGVRMKAIDEQKKEMKQLWTIEIKMKSPYLWQPPPPPQKKKHQKT